MVTNTSATGGYLQPAPTPAPLEDQSLEDFLQQIFVGISGLPATLVFPRWQPEPPDLPPFGTDWAAFGLTQADADTFAVDQNDTQGNANLQRHELLNLLCSFYGPRAWTFASAFRDGLQVAQNRWVLTSNGMGLVDTGELVSAPQLFKNLWTHRVDMRWTVRRAIQRKYPVLNLLTAFVTLIVADTKAGSISETINVQQTNP